MEKMDSNSVRLATELRQVIQTDRMAAELVNNAYDTKRSVEKRTLAEKQKILQEAEEKRREAMARVAEEQREELARRKKAAAMQYAGARQALKDEMGNNKEAWAAEIVQRVLGTGQG